MLGRERKLLQKSKAQMRDVQKGHHATGLTGSELHSCIVQKTNSYTRRAKGTETQSLSNSKVSQQYSKYMK